MAGDQIAEVKEKIDIVDLISQHVPLKKAGKNYKGLCPFHDEKTPSFMVSPELQIWKCFGCGESGDCYTFLMKMEGMEFGEALRTLAQKAGIKLKSYRSSPEDERRKRILEINHLAEEYFHYLLTTHEVGKSALGYLEERRGYDLDTIEEFKLGYAPNSWDSLGNYLLSKGYTLSEIVEAGLSLPKKSGRGFYDRFRGRIIFPLKDYRGRVVGFSGRALRKGQEPKYLNTPESLVFKKSGFLYGLFYSKGYIRKVQRAVVVEGPTDFLTLFSLGTKNAVASQGTSLTLRQVKLLKRYTPEASICFDTDLAGNLATRRGIGLAEKEGLEVSVISLPEEFKDADECARADFGIWQEAAANPIPVYDFYLQSALKKYDRRTPEGRKRVAQEFLPVVKEIPDDIQRISYVQKLASELGMEVGVIERALVKIPPSSGQTPTSRGHIFEEKTYPPKEFYILSLILKAPRDRAEAVLYRLGQNDFSHPQLREFFRRLKRYHRLTKRFRVKNFRAKIKSERELVELLEVLVLRDFDFPLEGEELDEEVEVTFCKLKEERARRRVRELSWLIKEAEVGGDRDRVVKLQRELGRSSSRLK